MSSPLRIRPLTRADLPFADRVRGLAGWNQTLADWERFLATEPDGCFLAEWNGEPAGTATTTVYGPALAWIGMVLVHPDHRRRGIGRALLDHCVDALRRRGVRGIKLDATPAGKMVYDGLGFQAEWTLTRWAGPAPMGIGSGVMEILKSGFAGPRQPQLDQPRLEPTERGPVSRLPCGSLRPWQRADLPAVAVLDAAVFGVSRGRLLRALAEQSLAALVLEGQAGQLAGFGVLRPGARAVYLGPVVAVSDSAGLALIETLLARCGGELVFWDIPDANIAAAAWAEQHGFTRQRPLTRMFLGGNAAPGDPCRQFALSGPETG